MAATKYDYIDAIRGVAILSVVLTHCAEHVNYEGPEIFSFFLRHGARGVQLFFIASAFTLFLSFKNRFYKENDPIKNFFIRRVFRIAPIYYLGIFYFLFQNGLSADYSLKEVNGISIYNIISNFVFVHGFSPYWINDLVPGGWSITVEMLFYLFIPILFSQIRNLNQAFIFFGISLLFRLAFENLLLKFSLIPPGEIGAWFLFFYFPSQLPIFALGIILFFIIEEDKPIKVWILIGFSLFMILLKRVSGFDTSPAIHILFGVAFVILSLFLRKYNPKIIVNPVVNYIGKISFSMYLVHFAVIHWFKEFGLFEYSLNNPILSHGFRFLVILLPSILISTFFYRFVEVPFQKIGKRIIDKREASISYKPSNLINK